MAQTIFFSWQADTPSQTGRKFLKDIFNDICKGIAADTSVDEALRDVKFDSDTRGVPGQPPIFDTILKKIDSSAVFVADLTFVGKREKGNRPTPNPNVLIEYGWALKSLKYERIICVMNTFYGKPTRENLPFDLSHLRQPICYNLPPDADSAAKLKASRKLAKLLDEAIRASMEAVPPKQEGVIAEWMHPDWFKFGATQYSNLIPSHVNLSLQVYFRNTTDDPCVLQFAKADFERDGRFWGGQFIGAFSDPHQEIPIGSSFPKTIPRKESVPFYFRFVFSIGAPSPEEFIKQLRESPDLIFKISYRVKEGPDTHDKIIQQNLVFREEFKKIYGSYLGTSPRPDAQQLTQSLDN